jgi:hypothetical protein
MLVILAFGTCGFVWIKNSFSVRIDGVEASLIVGQFNNRYIF